MGPARDHIADDRPVVFLMRGGRRVGQSRACHIVDWMDDAIDCADYYEQDGKTDAAREVRALVDDVRAALERMSLPAKLVRRMHEHDGFAFEAIPGKESAEQLEWWDPDSYRGHDFAPARGDIRPSFAQVSHRPRARERRRRSTSHTSRGSPGRPRASSDDDPHEHLDRRASWSRR
jgi:hypothetical protein